MYLILLLVSFVIEFSILFVFIDLEDRMNEGNRDSINGKWERKGNIVGEG